MSTNLKNLLQNLKSPKKLSDCGQNKVKSKQLKLMEVIEDTSMTKLTKNNKKSISSTPESPLKNNNRTFRDKLNSFKNSIQSTQSSLISLPVLISTGEGLTKFWQQSSPAQLEKLWLPTETDCVDLDLNSLKTFANISKQLLPLSTIKTINPLSTNWQKTSCLLLQFSQQDFMENENTLQEETYITRKIRIYPNQKQKLLFNKCIHTSRFFYNKANKHILDLKETQDKFKLPSVIDLRNEILVNDSDLDEKNLWQKEVPYDTRELAIRRLYKSYKTSIALLKNKHIDKFEVKYKKKRDNEKSFEVNKNAISFTSKGNIRIFKQRLKDELRLRKRDRKKIKSLNIDKPYTNTIIKKEYNNWYICISIPKEKINIKKEEPIFSSVFLDPGTRKFQSFYSPDGICGNLGERFCKKEITPIVKEYDKYKSVIGNKNLYKNERNIKRRCGRLITKVKNKVSDLHNQTANMLTTTFKSIFIPIFETKEMIKKEKRNITKTTVKELLNLSHYKFRNKLKNMCKIRGNNYKVVGEEKTSKTCTGCGKYNKDLGSSETYDCKKCGIKIDRDINASRNICIKNIKEYGATPLKSS